jgi:hypothetical protein
MEQATNFIQAYGFDPGDPEDVDLMWRAFDESVTFLERSIADPEYPEGSRPPQKSQSRQ